MATATGRRRLPLRWAAPALLLALLLPLGVGLGRLMGASGADIDFAERERAGIVQLRPLSALLAALTDAQSRAVAGRAVDTTAVAAAVRAVDAARETSERLGTTERWKDLRGRIERLDRPTGAGRAALVAYTQVVDLTSALIAEVGDSSNLILDPALDAYYVVDTVLLRLPALIVAAGRMSDLAALTRPATAASRAATVDLSAADVRRTAAALDTGLRKSFAATGSRTLGPALLPRLDRLRNVLTELVPPADDVGLVAPRATPAQLAAARALVRDEALALDAVSLDQLDALLAERAAAERRGRDAVLVVTGLGLLAAALVCWFALPHRRRADAGGFDDPVATVDPVDPAATVDPVGPVSALPLPRVGRSVSGPAEDGR